MRDLSSFGYRQLLPFLNQMGSKGSDISSVKELPSENKVSILNKELGRSVAEWTQLQHSLHN